MPKTVEVPGIGNIEFPDSMSDADISAAIRKQTGGPDSGEPKSVGGFLSNAVTSTGNLIGQAASAVAHPVQTLKAMGSIPIGLYEKAGGPLPAPGPGDVDAAKQVDAMIDHFKQRYGSLDRAKETLYNDPAGFLGDLSAAAGGAGGALRGTGAVADAAGAARAASMLGETGKALGTVSEVTNPLTVPTKVAGRVAAPAAEATADLLRRSALKGGYAVTAPAGDVRGASQAMRESGIPFSEAGVNKVGQALQELRYAIGKRIQAFQQAGGTVDPNRVQLRGDELLARKTMQVYPTEDVRAVKKVQDVFGQNWPGPIPADVAQELKVGSGAELGGKYGQASTAQIEAEKALTRGLKEELELQIPELAGMNAKQAKLINLEDILGKAVNKYVNSGGFWGGLGGQLLSREGLLGGGIGVATGHSGTAAAALLTKALLSDPKVKTMLATGINFAQRNNPARWGAPSMATALGRIEDYRKALDGQQRPPITGFEAPASPAGQ
jgi:hypothetical protein